ncbi:hypothetical protein E2C01_076555 [Portunus trituberculatus]|uniref:Uncharacterized protein n=1 Tax=Portunus trituberculatus TaxID=210409 RepID=A0A5B7IIX3_PORTR|nr:hypothetical protein [Portunus trituberculatus]
MMRPTGAPSLLPVQREGQSRAAASIVALLARKYDWRHRFKEGPREGEAEEMVFWVARSVVRNLARLPTLLYTTRSVPALVHPATLSWPKGRR